MNERIKAALSQKIDSREKFDQFLRDHGLTSAICGNTYRLDALVIPYSFPAVTSGLAFTKGPALPGAYWWWVREMLRLKFGVYPSIEESSVIAACYANAFTIGYAPHVSVKDPGRIAVTMSPDDGARDKQTPISLGKWLRKVFPTMPDDAIQQAEATHRADISNELEVVRTAEEVEYVYTHMVGDTGCMRYAASYYGQSIHPSIVYSSPGYGVAVVRNAAGGITARAVVWENPEDPQDKRYVRIYGDSTLKRRLERNGYRMTGLAGAPMQPHPLPEHGDDWYVMPYLDAPGGRGSGVMDHIHHRVVLKGGQLVPVSTSEWDTFYRALVDAGLAAEHYGAATSTAGRVRLTPLPEDLFTYRCAISEGTYDRTVHKPVLVWLDGQARQVHPHHVPAQAMPGYAMVDGSRVECYIPCDVETFDHYGHMWPDTEHHRHRCGFARLSARYYPDETAWMRASSLIRLSDGEYAKPEDVVVVQMASGGAFRMKSEVQKDWVRLHRSTQYPGKAVYATPDGCWGITRSGVKVGRHTHDVDEVAGGGLEFRRNIKRVRLYGAAAAVSVVVHKDCGHDELFALSVKLNKDAVDHAIAEDGAQHLLESPQMLRRLVTRLVRADGFYHPAPGGSWGYTSIPDLVGNPVEEALRLLAAYREGLASGLYTVAWSDGVAAHHIEVLQYLKQKLDEFRTHNQQTTQDAERFVVAA